MEEPTTTATAANEAAATSDALERSSSPDARKASISSLEPVKSGDVRSLASTSLVLVDKNWSSENEWVEVATFDECIDNFFSDMDCISNLCSSSSQNGLNSEDIDRFSSMITFLKEWKYFQYEPRTVCFPCGSDRTDTGISSDPVRREFKLSQFSSAAIPNTGELDGESDLSCSDFVSYAGGSVWALDWCPRADDKGDSSLTCEYLAVSAHPPGSNYHKIGASLKGRGVIQIWCVITSTETVESSKPSYRTARGRPKKALNLKDSHQDDKQKPSAVRRPRGRPKKVPLMDGTSGALVAEPKKRGRPKKVPLMDGTSGALVAEPKKRGRPRKRSEEDTCVKVPKKRGRPRKHAPHSNEKEDELLSPVILNLEGAAATLALPPPPDANSAEKCNEGRCKEGFGRQEVCPVDSSAEPHTNTENSADRDVTSNEYQMVEFNSIETENNEAKLARSVCCRKGTQLPKLVYCLGHYGRVAWDVKWKPFETGSTACMGFLAVLLGNGSLEVWEVPVPSTVQRLYRSRPVRGEGTDPRFLKLKSIFRCSKLTFGNRQSIPLTLEWSPSPSSDMILAGCHDGTVALWKFAAHTPCEDSKPLLVFTADSSPIRSLAWAPHDRENAEDANLFVVAGPEGLKFWDIRDPYHSLWEVNPAHRAVVSVDWLKDPRCILMTLEDGTMKIFSLPKGANDLPVTGMPLPRKQFEGVVAYCVADGSVVVFQMNERFLEPDPSRNRTKYFYCDCLKEEGGIIELGPPFRNTILPNLPLKPIKGPSRYVTGDDKALVSATDHTPRDEQHDTIAGMSHDVDDSCDNTFPSKLTALHKVRWNINKGTERWLCYGGASGIIRIQKISFNY